MTGAVHHSDAHAEARMGAILERLRHMLASHVSDAVVAVSEDASSIMPLAATAADASDPEEQGAAFSGVAWLRCSACDHHRSHVFVLDERAPRTGSTDAGPKLMQLWCACSSSTVSGALRR